MPFGWGNKPQVQWPRHWNILKHVIICILTLDILKHLLWLSRSNYKWHWVGLFFLLILIDNKVLLANLLPICENIHPFPPLWLAKVLPCLFLLEIKCFICHIHDQVNNLWSYFDVDASFLQLLLSTNSFDFILFSFFLFLAGDFSFLSNFAHLIVNFFVLYLFSHLLLESNPSFVINDHLLTLSISPHGVSLIFLLSLLLKESLNHLHFLFLGIKGLLDYLLVDVHLAKTSFPLFSSKFIVVLSLFDLIHGCCIREILNLAWRNSSFFHLSLHSFLNCNILVDTLLLHVFLEPFKAFLLIFVMKL